MAGEEEEKFVKFLTAPQDLANVQSEMVKLGYTIHQVNVIST